LKKLSKLFCFWEDNLALAKFQSPTDTLLNNNLPPFLTKNPIKKSKRLADNLLKMPTT
jgi:hypothetical protein